MPTIAEALSSYAYALNYEDLPREVIHQTKRTVIDTLGCAFGGYASEPARIARQMASRITSSQPATILYNGQKTSVDLAAFANDVMVRYLDFNDGYVSTGGGHPSGNVSPLLAAAEIAQAGGRDLILAIVLAYEVYCRFNDALDFRTCGIDQVTIGGIACALGAGKLLGLTEKELIEAINLTVAANISLRQTRTGVISNWKACGYANAGRNALFAAQLAQCGMTGPAPIFEGRYGFFNVVSRQHFELAPLGGNDSPFRIMRCHTKQYPVCNHAQTAVGAALQARELIGSNLDEVEVVHVRVSQKALDAIASDPEKWRPENHETADHSLPYVVGVAMMYGTIEQKHFEPEYLTNPKLLDFVARIKCSASDEANRRATETFLSEIEVVLRSGEQRSTRGEYHRGHWRNPASDVEIEAKFRSLITDMLPATQTDALLDQLWKLDDLIDVKTLLRSTINQSFTAQG